MRDGPSDENSASQGLCRTTREAAFEAMRTSHSTCSLASEMLARGLDPVLKLSGAEILIERAMSKGANAEKL